MKLEFSEGLSKRNINQLYTKRSVCPNTSISAFPCGTNVKMGRVVHAGDSRDALILVYHHEGPLIDGASLFLRW